jgi:hypothetical protein
VPSDSDDWKRQPSLQGLGLSPLRPLVHAGYNPAADLKYTSDTLRSPSLTSRTNLNVAIPSSRADRGLERLPSPASVSLTRQNSSAPASFCIRDRNTSSRLSAASLQSHQQPNSTLPATSNRPPSSQRPGLDRAIRAASSGPSSSVQPIGFPQTLAQIARTGYLAASKTNLSGLQFRDPGLSSAVSSPARPGRPPESDLHEECKHAGFVLVRINR